MHRARLSLSRHLLQQVLHLPKDLIIMDATFDPLTDGIELVVEHPKFPEVQEGQSLPLAVVSMTRHMPRLTCEINVEGTVVRSEEVG